VIYNNSQPLSLNETFELETPSKHLIAKSSLLVIEDSKPEKIEYDADCSLNELMIPFSLSSHDKTIEELQPKKEKDPKKSELKLDIPCENSKLIENLQIYNMNLKAMVAILNLNDSDSEIIVNSSEFIKIFNSIGEMEKSLKIIKSKMSSK